MTENPPILTIWDSNSSETKGIKPKQTDALKRLLLLLGATRVTKRPKGAVEARFKTWKAMEDAHKNVLAPLSVLFSRRIDTSYGRVNGL
jgi:hypothetical protein